MAATHGETPVRKGVGVQEGGRWRHGGKEEYWERSEGGREALGRRESKDAEGDSE